jgi:hypothetical protein
MTNWQYCSSISETKAFFFNYLKDIEGKIILNDIENFRVAIISNRLLSNFIHGAAAPHGAAATNNPV